MTDESNTTTRRIDVSVVVPLLNEAESIDALYEELIEVISREALRYEVIFVDDGSRDDTLARLERIAAGDARVKVIQFTRNFGQTASLAAGFRRALGRIIVPMDGDRQNDPHDIPGLVAKLDEPPGWDIVSGWRKDRQDKFVTRRLPSIIANAIIRKLTWTREVHDFGCSMKAYRRDVLEDVRLYGEMHRFLPAICKWRGARVTEVVVNHRPRLEGTSKYGLRRTVKVMLDLLTVKFIGDYLTKPIYFFGKLTMVTMAVAFLALGIALAQKFGVLGEPVKLNNNVLLLLSMMLCLMSIMFLMMGVLSELLVRVYHESQARTPYKIRRTIFGGGGAADGADGSGGAGGAGGGHGVAGDGRVNGDGAPETQEGRTSVAP